MVATRSSTRSASGGAPPTPMANPASNSLEIDPVSKARTITHMNKDHAADLSAILRHRVAGGLTDAQAADAEMLDLDLATMTIRAGSDKKIYTVDIEPPMAHWNDRRSRLIDMTLEARKALGLPISAEEEAHAASSSSSSSSQTIKWYPPEGADLVPFTGVLFDYVASLLVWTGQLAPGTFLWKFLEEKAPFSPAGFAWAVTTAFPLFVAAHMVEMFWFDRSRLAPAGVKRGSWVWFQWLGCQLIDGFATFQRWDRRIVGKKGGDDKVKKEL